MRSFEIPLDNWTKNCVISNIAGGTKLYIPIVILSTDDNIKLTKKLNEGFKIPAYWNKHKTKIESKLLNNNNATRFSFGASFQGVKRLFVFAFNNTTVNAANNPINLIITLKETVTENIFFKE